MLWSDLPAEADLGRIFSQPARTWLGLWQREWGGRSPRLPQPTTPLEYARLGILCLAMGHWQGAMHNLKQAQLSQDVIRDVLDSAGPICPIQAGADENLILDGQEEGSCNETGGLFFDSLGTPNLSFSSLVAAADPQVYRAMVDVIIIHSASSSPSVRLLAENVPTLLLKLTVNALQITRLRGWVAAPDELTTQIHCNGTTHALLVAPFNTVNTLTDLMVISANRLVWLHHFKLAAPGTPLVRTKLSPAQMKVLDVSPSQLPMADPITGPVSIFSNYKQPPEMKSKEILRDVLLLNKMRILERTGLSCVPQAGTPEDYIYQQAWDQLCKDGGHAVGIDAGQAPNDVGTTAGILLGDDPACPLRSQVTNYSCSGSSHGVATQQIGGKLHVVGWSYGKCQGNYNLLLKAQSCWDLPMECYEVPE
eukprot:TRINITY_DN9633_c1_g2_i2.p1 TRINITY_DN9633_c1_g2~~TRINITY_DN9633_c1_g2_i2.p1  ORF type:complete len:422 (-),score=42.93 TRINITY_DN9633_c1_g2_i2:466-1731(-)